MTKTFCPLDTGHAKRKGQRLYLVPFSSTLIWRVWTTPGLSQGALNVFCMVFLPSRLISNFLLLGSR